MSSEPQATDAFAPRARPGALIAGLALWLATAVVVSCLAAPLVYRALLSLSGGAFPFDRVFRRVAMIVALVVLVLWLRRSGVRSWAAAGFTRAGWGSGAAWRWAAIGAAAIGLLVAVELLAGTRVVRLEVDAGSLAAALLGGLLIGLLEEGVCRGALVFPFGRIRGAGLVAAVLAVSLVYATGHFLRSRVSFTEVDWTSGFKVLSRIGPAVAGQPAAWFGLFVLALVFDRMTRRQGHVWGAAGLHAGAVAALKIASDATDPVRVNDSLFFTNGLHPDWPLAALLVVVYLVMTFAGPRRRLAPIRAPESAEEAT